MRNSAKAVDEAAEVALTELRALELCYLCLTVVGPFLGAMLIRYVFAAMEGVDSLSWFSTTLFVLATGIRPWSHLITRLQERTSELHETVDLPSSEQRERETDKKLQVVMKRLDALEDAVIQLRAKAANIAPLQEACDELNDALGDVERSLLRQERKVETTRISQGSRLAVMESNVYRLEDLQRKDLLARRSSSRATATLEIPVYPRIHYALARLFELPTKLHTTVLTYLAANSAQKTLENASSSPPHSPLHNNSDQVHYFNGTPLETIPEAADSDSDGTYVSDRVASPPSKASTLEKKRKIAGRSRSRSRSASGPHPSLRRQQSFSHKAYDWATAVVSWPYHCALNILIMVVPLPIQRLFT